MTAPGEGAGMPVVDCRKHCPETNCHDCEQQSKTAAVEQGKKEGV